MRLFSWKICNITHEAMVVEQKKGRSQGNPRPEMVVVRVQQTEWASESSANNSSHGRACTPLCFVCESIQYTANMNNFTL